MKSKLVSCLLVCATFTAHGQDSQNDKEWYDTFDYFHQGDVEEFWINSPGMNPPVLVRDPKQGDGHMLRVEPGGSLVGKRTGSARNWWVKVHGPDILVNYQRFGIRNADDSKHVLFYFDQPEPERVRIDIRGGEQALYYGDAASGAAAPSQVVQGLAGLWHFQVSKEDGVKVTLNDEVVFEGGPEFGFEDDEMRFVFESHYGGAVVDFEFISTVEP